MEQAARHIRAAPFNSTPRRQQQSRSRSVENGLDLTDDSYIDSDSVTGAFCDDEADEFDPAVRSRAARVNGNYDDDMTYAQSLPRMKRRDNYHDGYGTPQLVRRNHDNSHKSVMFSDDSSDVSSSVCEDIDDAQTLQKSRQTKLQSATPTTPGRRYVRKQNAANISSTSSSGTANRSTPSSYSRLGSQSPSVTRMARSQSPSILKSARSPSPSILKPGRSPSPSILKPGRSPSPSILKPGRSPSPSILKRGRSPSPSILKPGRSPSPSILKPARNESPSTVGSASSQPRAARLTGAARMSYSSLFRGQTTGTRPSRAVAGDPQSRTQLRDKSGDRSLDSGTYRSREKSQERFMDRDRARERSGDRMLDANRARAREKSGDRMLDVNRARARETSGDRMLDANRTRAREKSGDRMLDNSRARPREKAGERMVYDRNRERMKSGSDNLESSRAREREKSWDRLLANSRTRGREKSGDGLSTVSSRAKAREKSGDRVVGRNRAKSKERFDAVKSGRSGNNKWLDDESSWDTTGSYGQNSPISPVPHALLPQPFSSKVRTVAKVTPPETATNSPRSRQSSEHTPSDRDEDYGIDQEDASELLNVNETKSYSYCEVMLHDDDNRGATKGRSGRRQWSTSGAAISSLKYKMNSMSTPSLYTSMDEQDDPVMTPEKLSPSTHDHRSPQNHRTPRSHDYESPTHDYRSKRQDYGSCDTLSSPQEYRSLSRNHGSQSQTVREATNTAFRRTPLTRSIRRQQWQQKHAAADDATKKSRPSTLEKLGQSLCKSLSPSAIFDSFDHQFDENKNKVSPATRTATSSSRAALRRGSAGNVTAKTNFGSVGHLKDTSEPRARPAVVTPSKTSDNVRKVNPVTPQPQGHHTWQTPGDVASDTASSSEALIAKALPVDPTASNMSIPDMMVEGSLLGKSRDKDVAENWILCDDGHPSKEGGHSHPKVPSKPKLVTNRFANNPLIDRNRPFSPFTANQKRSAQGKSACDDNNNAADGEKHKDIPASPLGIVLFGSKTLFGSKAMNHGIPQSCDSTSSSEEEEEDASEEQQCDRVSEATSDYRAKHMAPSSMQLQQQQRDRTNETASNYYAKHTAPSGEQPLQQQRNPVSEAALNYHAKHTTPPSEQPVQQGARVSEAALNYHAKHTTPPSEQPVQQGARVSEAALNYHAKHTTPPSEQPVQQGARVSEAALNYHAKHTTPPSEQPVQQGARGSEAALNYHAKHAALQVEQPVQYQHGRVGASVVSQRQPRRQTIATLPAEGEVNTTVDTSADDKVSPRGLSPRTRPYRDTAMTSPRETQQNTRTQPHREESEQQQVAPRVHNDNEAPSGCRNMHVARPGEQPVQYERSHVGASVVSQRQPRRQTIAAFTADGEDNTGGDKQSPRMRLYGDAAVTPRRETHRYARTQQHGEADSSSPREPTRAVRLEPRREMLAKSCEQLDSSDSSPSRPGRYYSPRSRGILKHTYAKPKTYAAHNGSGPSWLDSHNKGNLRGSHAKSCEQLDAPQDSWHGNEGGSLFARSRSFRELQQRSRGSKSSLTDVGSEDQPSAQSYVNSLPRRRSNKQTAAGDTLTSGRFRHLTDGGDAYSLSQENITDDAVFADDRNLSNKQNKVNGQGRGEPEFLMYL